MNTLQISISEFLFHCQFEKNLNIKTLKAYKIDLLQLNNFLLQKKYSNEITQITKNELREFLASMSNLKPKSIKRKVASAKALFNYLEFEDQLQINPFRRMRIKIKDFKRLPLVMDMCEITQIFKIVYNKPKTKNECSFSYFEAIRNIAIIELLFNTGARVSEISNLRVDSVDLDAGSILIKGKGSKERTVQICNKETIKALAHYDDLCKDRIASRGGVFLVNRLGRKLSDQSIRAIVKKIVENTTISKHITPHIFRHSLATLLLEKDVSLRHIQTILGHSSITTTQIYTHINPENQRQILKAKHPRKDFTMKVLIS